MAAKPESTERTEMAHMLAEAQAIIDDLKLSPELLKRLTILERWVHELQRKVDEY